MEKGEFFKSVFNNKIFIRLITELWEMETQERRLIAPTLPHNHYASGIGLFLVDIGYCKKT